MTNYVQSQYASDAAFIQGMAAPSTRVFEGYRQDVETCTDVCRGHMVHASLDNGKKIDVSWLASAAEIYHISPNLADYIIAEIPIVTVDIPNRRMDCFPFSEISKFRFIHGRTAYKTFLGKPTFRDHKNQIKEEARGVHFDASLHPWVKTPDGRQIWKVSVLAGFDRGKDEALANDILRKVRTGYSMGALVDYTTCSICSEVTSGNMSCEHQPAKSVKGSTIHVEGELRLIYDMCHNINFIETSSVEEPADFLARTTLFWRPSKLI